MAPGLENPVSWVHEPSLALVFSCANWIRGLGYGRETAHGMSTAHSAGHTGGVPRKMPVAIGKGEAKSLDVWTTVHVSCMVTFWSGS